MPTTVNVPGRGKIIFDDNVSDAEIQQIVQKEFPVNGEDVVRSIAEDPSYAQRMSRDDFMEMRRYKDDNPIALSTKLAEAFGGIAELATKAVTEAPKFNPAAGPIEKGVSLVANIGQGALVGTGDFANMFLGMLEGYSNDNNSYTRYRLANDLKDTPENKAAYEQIIDKDFENFKALQTWQQTRKDILGQSSMPAMAETISLVAQPPLPGAALLEAAGVGERIGMMGARAAQMGGKGIQAVGEATSAVAKIPQQVAGAAAQALTGSEKVGGMVEKAVATGSTGLAAGQLGGFAIPGLSTAATTIAGAKAIGKGLEVAGEVTQKLAEHAGNKAGRLGVFESLANDLSASTAARAIGRIGSVAGADVVAPYIAAAARGAGEGALIGSTLGFITDGEEGAAGGMGAGLALGGFGGLVGRGYAQGSGMLRRNKIQNDAVRGIANLEPESRANASRLFDQFIKDGNHEAVAEMVDAKNWLSGDVYFSFINNEQAKAMPAAKGTSFEGITVFPSEMTKGKPAIYINVDTVKPGTGFHESFHGAMRTALGETFGKKFTDVINQTYTPEEKTKFVEDYVKRGGTEEGKQNLRDYLAEKQNLPEEIGAEYFREFLQRRENRDYLLRGQRNTDGSLIAATKGAIDYTLSKLGIDYDATGTGYKGMDALASELIKARTDINKSIAQNGKPLAPVTLDKMPTAKLEDWAKQHGQTDVLLKDPATGQVVGVKTEEQVNIGREAVGKRIIEELSNVVRGTNYPNDAEMKIYQKHLSPEQFAKLAFYTEAIKGGNGLNSDHFPASAKKGETSVYASRGMTNLDNVPYKIRISNKGVLLIDYLDLTQLKARFDDMMSRSKISEQWGGDKDAAWKDVVSYSKNLSLGEGAAKPSAELFGPIKRDIINKIYGFVPTKAQISEGAIKNISSLGTNVAAESGTGKSQIGKPAYEGSKDTRVVSTMRLDRLGRIADTGRQFSFNENGTYGLSQVNFKPAENLGSAKVNNSDEGFRIISKNNKHSLYAPTGERIGIYDTQAKAESVSSKIQNQSTQISVSQPKVVDGIVTAPKSGAFKFTKDVAANFMPADSKVRLDDYADRTIIALAADRMGVGQAEVGPLSNRKTLSVPTQGGRGFMKIFNGGGWAFSDIGTTNKFLSRLKPFADKNGNTLVGVTVLNEINHLNNRIGQLAYVETLQAAIEGGAVSKSQADAHIKEISKRIQDSKANPKDLPQSTRDLFSSINNLDSLVNAVKNREINFNSAAWLVEKAQQKTLPISYDEASSKGMSVQQIARGLTDKELLDIPNYSVVALMEVNVNQKPDLNNFHHAYPVTVHGKTVGFLDKFYNLADLSTEPKIRNKAGAVTAQPVQNVMPVMDNIRNTLKTQQGIPSDPAQRVNFMPDTPESKFYSSRIISAVENSSQGKANGSQWKATIKNSKLGVNQDEYALVGVGDLEDGKTYTKAEVLDYLRANEVVVKDVTLGGDAKNLPALKKAYRDEAWNLLSRHGIRVDESNIGRLLFSDKRTGAILKQVPDGAIDVANKLNDINDAIRSSEKTDTHFSEYTLPGAEEGSYREVLLTVPEKNTRQEKLDAITEKSNRLLAGRSVAQLSENERTSYSVFERDFNKIADNTEKSGGWRDGHDQYSDIPNPIVRLRTNERTTADGKRMLFIEEVQAPQKKEFEKMPALFQKNWREIAFKWALRTAADNGFDLVGYTTGKQQAERYDLSKQLSEISYSGSNLKAYDKDGNVTVSKTGVKPEELPDIIGKEAAKKLMEQEPKGTLRTISGLDLNVGGEGLKKLYDQDFRNVVNNLPVVKKSGQKVGMADILADKKGWHLTPPNQTTHGGWMVKSDDYNSQGTRFSPTIEGEAAARAFLAERLNDSKVEVYSINVAPEMRNASVSFMPSVKFSAPEKLPNGQAWSTDNKYRVIQKEGGKFRVYAPTGTLIGVADTLDKSKKLIEKRSR